MIGNIFGTLIVLAVIGIIAYTIWTGCKAEKEILSFYDCYKQRKNDFVASASQRQRDLNQELKGASDTEIIMRLEQRIYDLEQEIKNKRDDGK